MRSGNPSARKGATDSLANSHACRNNRRRGRPDRSEARAVGNDDDHDDRVGADDRCEPLSRPDRGRMGGPLSGPLAAVSKRPARALHLAARRRGDQPRLRRLWLLLDLVAQGRVRDGRHVLAALAQLVDERERPLSILAVDVALDALRALRRLFVVRERARRGMDARERARVRMGLLMRRNPPTRVDNEVIWYGGAARRLRLWERLAWHFGRRHFARPA